MLQRTSIINKYRLLLSWFVCLPMIDWLVFNVNLSSISAISWRVLFYDLLIDWCLTSTLAVCQLHHVVSCCKINWTIGV